MAYIIKFLIFEVGERIVTGTDRGQNLLKCYHKGCGRLLSVSFKYCDSALEGSEFSKIKQFAWNLYGKSQFVDNENKDWW